MDASGGIRMRTIPTKARGPSIQTVRALVFPTRTIQGSGITMTAFSPYARYALGAGEMSADEFMGTNAWRDVTVTGGINWWYLYDSASDFGMWSRNGTTQRFSYDYANGRWWDNFTGFSSVPYQLSADGTSAQFIADGTYRALGNWNGGAWWYKDKYTEDEGWWARDTSASGARFSFAYGTGQWYHHDAFSPYNRVVIGNAEALASEFIGSGDWRNVGPMLSSWIWYYQYNYTDDAGAWSVTDTSSNRLRYTYSNGTWGFWERGDRWVTISDVNRSVQDFIGYNGSWHYLWDSSVATWQFNMDLSTRFVIRSTYNTSWQYLGTTSHRRCGWMEPMVTPWRICPEDRRRIGSARLRPLGLTWSRTMAGTRWRYRLGITLSGLTTEFLDHLHVVWCILLRLTQRSGTRTSLSADGAAWYRWSTGTPALPDTGSRSPLVGPMPTGRPSDATAGLRWRWCSRQTLIPARHTRGLVIFLSHQDGRVAGCRHV